MEIFHPHYVTLKNGRAALVRFVEPRDAEALIDCVNEIGSEMVYIMTEKLPHSPAEEEEILRRIDRRVSLFLVATVDGRLVASADVHQGRPSKSRHTGSLGIAIRREARGQGLGKAMMEDMIRWSRSVGIKKLTLGVFETNAPAISLYRECGFREEARLKGQVVIAGRPVDEILMARWL